MDESINKITKVIVLVILVISLDIWLIMPMIESYNVLSKPEVMAGTQKADLSVAGNMIKNPFLSIKKIGEGDNIIKWFIASIVVDGGITMIFYLLINKSGEKRILNGKSVNYSKNKGTHGTAHWMTDKELRDKSMKDIVSLKGNDGIMFGKLPYDEKVLVTLTQLTRLNKNIAIFGAPGTGKSRCFVRPTAINLANKGESMIFTDPKGELFRSLGPYLKSKGYELKTLNLVDMVYSDRWNPLDEVKDDISAQTFAQVIIDNTSGATSPERTDFWTRTETNLLKALALYVVMEMPPKDANMKTLYSLVASKDAKQTERVFKTLRDNHPALQPFNLYCQANETVKTGAVGGLGTRLQVFQSKLIQDLTAESDFKLAMPGVKKCAYFCITSDMQSTFDFLSGLFFSFLFIDLIRLADSSSKGRCKVPVNFILDEFPNIARISDFTKKISTARSRGINCFVIFQSIAQLQNRYRNMEWDEILGSCDSKLFLGCNDTTTAKYISEVLGTATIEDDSITKQQGLEGVFDYGKKTDKTGKRNLLNLNEVLNFDGDKAILMLRGKNPLILSKYDISEHPEAKKLIDKPVNSYRKEWSEEYRKIQEEALKDELRKLGINYEEDDDFQDTDNIDVLESKNKIKSEIQNIPGKTSIDNDVIENKKAENNVIENNLIASDNKSENDKLNDTHTDSPTKDTKIKVRKKETRVNGQISLLQVINDARIEEENNLKEQMIKRNNELSLQEICDQESSFSNELNKHEVEEAENNDVEEDTLMD